MRFQGNFRRLMNAPNQPVPIKEGQDAPEENPATGEQKSDKGLLPKHFPIAYKLAIVITLLISSGMVLLGLVIVTNQTQLLTEQMDNFSETVVEQFAESSKELVLSDDILSLMVLISNLGANESILGAVVYADNGKVLASSGMLPNEGIMNTYKQLHAEGNSQYSSEWQTTLADGKQLDVTSFIHPIRFQGLVAGHVLVNFSKEALSKSIYDTVRAIGAATLFMILLGIVSAYLMGQRLSRPIHNLMDASKAIDSGNYDYRIKEKRNDEIGYLIDAFNNMASGLLQKSQVESAFSRFVSTSVAKQIMSNLDHVELGGQHVKATAMFADIVGFTKISEKLQPQEVASLLNEYFSYISLATRLYNGTIDKYMGDCAMVIFGAPEHDEKHMFNSIACAVMFQRLVERLNTIRVRDGKFPIHFRIGINSGDMLAGNMGSHDRMQYTVVGDAVNLASRLHTAAEGGQIIVTNNMVKDPDVQWRIHAHRHASVKLRGIENPVTTYIVTDVKHNYSTIIDTQINEILANKVVA